MKKISLILGLLPLTAFAASDAEIALVDAMNNVRSNCSGISDKMAGIKQMAGIGTAVNAVGTATGVGGVVSGAVKFYKDQNVAELTAEKAGVDSWLSVLKTEQQAKPENVVLLNEVMSISPKIEKNLQDLMETVAKDEQNKQGILEQRSNELQAAIDKKEKESTAAGIARTSLFAADTVTNVAGAVVSSKTMADDDFIEQIKKCTESVDLLKNARARVQVETGDEADATVMNASQNILNKCGEYQYVDLSKINNLAKGAIITNSVGAATGVAATATSIAGNSKKAQDEYVKTAEDWHKYNNTNIASNVLGGVTAAASLTGTVLNATQIKEAKNIINIASECEEALK